MIFFKFISNLIGPYTIRWGHEHDSFKSAF